MTVEQYLGTAIGGLTAAIVHLYYRMDGLHKRCEADRQQCEVERKECEAQNDRLWERLTKLERAQ